MAELYMCPMDGYQAQTPRACPVCGMDLVEKDKAERERRRLVEDPGAMMLMHPGMTMYKWCQSAVMILGAWLATQPLLFDYGSRALVVSDVASGLACVVLACATLAFPRRAWLSYVNAAIGLWLMLAPLAFWAPTPASYLLDTLIGALLITFSFIIPMSMQMPGPEVPPGWTYNPSTWAQRVPIVLLGLVGFLLSRPMASYQLGHVEGVWEPFFGDGTVKVLTSKVSKAWPVSDAGLGAMTYMLEVLSTIMGDPRRWRTMPWMVGVFGLAVIPLGLTSIVLIVMQPLIVGEWCTLCLMTAAAMLLMIPLSLDEVVAMLQLLNHERKQGRSVWRAFWHGGTMPGAYRAVSGRRESWRLGALVGGARGTWTLYAASAAGVWLMLSPAVFGSGGAAADGDHLVGALIVAISTIAWAEVGRPFRFLNLPLGAWLVVAPFLLSGGTPAAGWNSAVVGLGVILLSLPLGRIRERYGTFEPWIAWPRRASTSRASGSSGRAVSSGR